MRSGHRLPGRIRRHQAGVTLVSMLIGVLVSLVAIAGMLALYKTTLSVTNDASREAIRDGQVVAGLLAAQVDLQSAGFGVPATEALATKFAVSANQVVWRYKANIGDAGYQCAGLKVDRGVLSRLTPGACATVVGWSGTPEALVDAGSGDFQVTNGGAEKGGRSLKAAAYAFSAVSATCLPYQQQAIDPDPAKNTVPTGQKLTLSAGTPETTLFSVCLSNLQT